MTGAWQPVQYENIELMWDGVIWTEITRSVIGAGNVVLTDGYLLVGDGSNVAQSVAMSGDVAIINTGATTIQAGAVDSAMISDQDSALKCAVATIGFADLNTS